MSIPATTMEALALNHQLGVIELAVVRFHLSIFHRALDDANNIKSPGGFTSVIEARDWIRNVGHDHLLMIHDLVPAPTLDEWRATLGRLEQEWREADLKAGGPLGRIATGELEAHDVRRVLGRHAWELEQLQKGLDVIEGSRQIQRRLHEMLCDDPATTPEEKVRLVGRELETTTRALEAFQTAEGDLTGLLREMKALRCCIEASEGNASCV